MHCCAPVDLKAGILMQIATDLASEVAKRHFHLSNWLVHLSNWPAALEHANGRPAQIEDLRDRCRQSVHAALSRAR